MKYSKTFLLIIIIFNILMILVISRENVNKSRYLESSSINLTYNDSYCEDCEGIPQLASGETYNLIEKLLDMKLDEFASYNYFFQKYEPSLQATYYALYILKALDKINEINQTSILDYILSCYNNTTGIFKDNYAERYLNTDFNANFYPLTSLLQVNCYAILSLELLGELNPETIDYYKMVPFIWDCYNTEKGGFIGQKFTSTLREEFKFSTMDNTYYAILALKALGQDWSSQETKKNLLITFIQGLQYLNPSGANYGGFDNSEAPFYTIYPHDPTLLSAYYSVKSVYTLEISNIIEINAFHQFLGDLYNTQVPCFKMGPDVTHDYDFDIIGSAFGLQLADLTTYTAYDRTGVINFMLNNRNSLGLWNSSTAYLLYELIDTFQVIRALNETGEISQLTLNDKNQIFTNIEGYFSTYRGYALISKQYYSVELMHSVIRAFHTYGIIEQLNEFFPTFYERLRYLYNYKAGATNWYYFNGWINNDYSGSFYPESRLKDKVFRSRPLEFFSDNYHEQNNELGLTYSHKTSFEALDTLRAIYKLDYFHNQYDLSLLAQNIVDTQFLDASYSNFGGFLPNMRIKSVLSPEAQNDYIYLEYTYFAIKALELISECSGEEDITNFGFNKNALGGYINRYFLNGHFNPSYTNDIHTIMRNTFYMVYIINLLDATGLTPQKIAEIKHFVESNLDYTNIKTIYFAYKICDLLNITVNFDLDITHNLIKEIYFDDYNAFFISLNRDYIDSEIISWIYDMAKHDEMSMRANYPAQVQLGTTLDLVVSLENIVLDYFGDDIELEYKSSDGEISMPLIRENNKYSTEIFIPKNQEYYPAITGEIIVTEGFIEIARFPITFPILSDENADEESSSSEIGNETVGMQKFVEPSAQMALPIMITLIAVPSFIMFFTTRKKRDNYIAES